jgi:DNA invertase Pin-like site-specific DNA recombinase
VPDDVFSYLRYSSPQQETGDSVRRQTEARERWLAGHPDARLDTSLVMTDAGRSAYKRKDWDTYALAQFIAHIKSGRVRRDSYLLVENLDRLSREDEGEATELFLSIVNKGVVVVQLLPAVKEFRKPVNVYDLMFAIMELSRGHGESKMKSERVGAAWGNKKAEARERAGEVDSAQTYRVPGWIKVVGRRRVNNRMVGGTFKLDPAGTAILRRVYQLARDGLGVHLIAERLNAEGVPVLGRKEITPRTEMHKPPGKRKKLKIAWNETVVYHLLTTRTVMGEYQPCTGRGSKREPSGDPVPDYYPRAIDADLFHAVQGGMQARAKCARGRRGSHVNLLAGLLVDARDGGSLTYKHLAKRPPTLIPVGAKQGRGSKWSSFPAEAFEAAVLGELVEVKAADVWHNGDAVHKVEVLAGQLAEAESLVKKWTPKMENPDLVDVVAEKLAELNARRKALAAQLAEAQRDADSPASEAWGEVRSLAELLAKDKSDELRLKARAALRRAILAVHCLFVCRGTLRLAAVRVSFRGSERHRDYLVAHDYRRGGPPEVLSFADLIGEDDLDLRKPDHVRRVEKFLLALPLPAAGGRAGGA